MNSDLDNRPLGLCQSKRLLQDRLRQPYHHKQTNACFLRCPPLHGGQKTTTGGSSAAKIRSVRELRPEMSKRNSLSEAKQTASAEKVVLEA